MLLRAAALTAALCPLGAQAQFKAWNFLPVVPLFHPLIADPEEPQTSLLAYVSQNQFQGSVGTAFELLRYTPADDTQWGWGLLGSGFILLKEDGASFPMQDGDWYGGMYVSEASGAFSHRLEFIHRSSHLGDALQGVREPLFYSRENLNYVLSFQPDASLRFHAGVGFWENIAPDGDPFFASLGMELYSPAIPFLGTYLRAYGTGHLQWKAEAGGILNQTYQAGWVWKSREEDARAIRLALVYYNGYSDFGQFYLDPDEHWAVGVYFDP